MEEINCVGCRYYNKEEDNCIAFECNGLECPILPCERQEKCSDCKHCQKLYVPPTYPQIADLTKDGYICTALMYEPDGWVMYLEDDKGFCEMYSAKEKEDEDNRMGKI